MYVERAAIKNFAYIINTVILALVFGLMYFFHLCDVSLLVYFSVPTAMIYIIGYYLIPDSAKLKRPPLYKTA